MLKVLCQNVFWCKNKKKQKIKNLSKKERKSFPDLCATLKTFLESGWGLPVGDRAVCGLMDSI